MIPELFRLGPIPVNSFGLTIALAMMAGIYRLSQSFRRNGIPAEFAERYVLTAGFTGLLGARVWHLIENYEELRGDLLAAALSTAGFTFYGGFLIACVVLLVMARRDKLPLAPLLDALGPSLALGYAIGRLGCQLAGDGDYGVATTSIWGMEYPTGTVPTPPGVRVYATPLFESAIAMAILGVLTVLERSSYAAVYYLRFSVYLVLIALERFFVEFIRVNPHVAWGLSQAQIVSLILAACGTVLFVSTFRATPPDEAHGGRASVT
jgi:phosphatidylglycerol---prolipoprotein diacylglyceryl transferase